MRTKFYVNWIIFTTLCTNSCFVYNLKIKIFIDEIIIELCLS